MYAAIIELLVSILTRAASFFAAFSFGKTVEENKHNKQAIDNVKKANDARADSSHDDELRKKYNK